MMRPLISANRRFVIGLAIGAVFISPFIIGNEPLTFIENKMRDGAAVIYESFAEMAQKVSRQDVELQTMEILLEENARLYQWQERALYLEKENARLRQMMELAPTPEEEWHLVPVLSDSGGLFTRSLLIKGGKNLDIRQGSIVRDNYGVLGFVAQVGDELSRILLLTDVNARIPVQLMSSGYHAILTGDNSNLPWLNFVEGADDFTPLAGERVVTSGRGGVFPAGLMVGTIILLDTPERTIRLEPFATPAQDSYLFVHQGEVK